MTFAVFIALAAAALLVSWLPVLARRRAQAQAHEPPQVHSYRQPAPLPPHDDEPPAVVVAPPSPARTGRPPRPNPAPPTAQLR